MRAVSLVLLGASALILAGGCATGQTSAKVSESRNLSAEGARLFALNCAHCHGADATGDEGPDLHGVTKSDAKISNLIKHGKKDEMPKFECKLSDQDIQALIAFIRSLRE